MQKLKICGIRTEESYKICVDSGIDYIGLNFCNKSHRKIKKNGFLSNLDRKNTKLVGVFMQNSINEILEITNIYKLDIIQVYDTNLISNLKKKLQGDNDIWLSMHCFDKLIDNVNLILFDNKNPGTGLKLDINKTKTICDKINTPFGIAGGINAHNILEFKTNFPNATVLDLASGVEKNKEFFKTKFNKIIKLFYGK